MFAFSRQSRNATIQLVVDTRSVLYIVFLIYETKVPSRQPTESNGEIQQPPLSLIIGTECKNQVV